MADLSEPRVREIVREELTLNEPRFREIIKDELRVIEEQNRIILETKADKSELRALIEALRQELKGDIKEVKGEIKALDERMSGKINALDAKQDSLRDLIKSNFKIVFGIVITILFLLIKVAFFP